MDSSTTLDRVADIQAAADLLIEAAGDEEQGTSALEMFSNTILVSCP